MRSWLWFCAALALLSGCKSSDPGADGNARLIPKMLEAPEWVRQSGNDPRYPRDRYLVGFGLSDDKTAAGLDQARIQAQTDIASQIEVQIKSRLDLISKQVRQNQDVSLKEDFTQISQSETAELFRGTTLVDSYQDPQSGRWHALAVLQREQLASALLNEADTLLAQIKTQHDEAQQAQKSHSPTVALRASLQAYAGAIRIEKNCARALAIEPRNPKIDQRVQALAVPELKSAIAGQLADLTGRVQVVVVSGDRQQGAVGATLAQPLAFRAEYHEDERTVPVSYFPIALALDPKAGRAVALRDTTDGEGTASFQLQELRLTGRNANTVSAGLAFTPYAGTAAQDLERKVTFTYLMPTIESTRVLVAIDERIDDQPNPTPVAAGRISDALTQIGVAVVKNDATLTAQQIVGATSQSLRTQLQGRAEYVVTGTVDCRFSSDQKLLTKVSYFYTTRISLNLIELLTGRELHIELPADQSTKDAAFEKPQAAAKSLARALQNERVLARLKDALHQRLIEGKEFGDEK